MKKCGLTLFLGLLPFFWLGAQSLALESTGYDMHAELNWEVLPSADRYEVYRRGPADGDFNKVTTTAKLRFLDWTGRIGDDPVIYEYYVKALSLTGILLATSDTVSTFVAPLSEDGWLDMVQAHTLRYFWEYAHPVSGMARERFGSGDIVTTGGTGFGVMAILVGIHRGWITREAGRDRLLQLTSFLQFADKFHGVFPHWMNGQTGKTIPFSTFDNGGDLVETAFLFEGLLCARTYFDRDDPAENTLRNVITGLWEAVDWEHYTRNNSGVLYWHWSPNFGWQMNFPIRGYNEGMMPYILAIASPTHPVPASYWHSGWAGSGYVNGFSWYSIKLFVGPPLGGPLFFAHYSYQGFDPRDIKDAYANYFEQNRNHTLLNRAWCMANPLHHAGYSDVCWGLTASDNPWGYLAHAPGGTTDNGTITPTAALSSMPYTPTESLAALVHFYRTYGQDLWGEYGFRDAFNPGVGWTASSYLAIDQGPIVNMIENYRSGLLWNLFMANPEITPALDAIGFVPDITAVGEPSAGSVPWDLYPNLTSDRIELDLSGLPEDSGWSGRLVDMDGRLLTQWAIPSGTSRTALDLREFGLPAGMYFLQLYHPRHGATTQRLIYQ